MSYIVAIDGPAGAGKSTIARMTAERLGLSRVDTGAIYRAVALASAEAHLNEPEAVGTLALSLPLEFRGTSVFLGERDVSVAIRSEAMSQRASLVSAMPPVRAALLELQRRLGRADKKGAVLEGRDIGTVVFPDAEVKIFLTASPEARASRRLRELETGDLPANYESVLAGIHERDLRDQSRSVAPLKPASDAIILDTTEQTLEEVLDAIIRVVTQRIAKT